MPNMDAIEMARASVDDGFENLPERIHIGILGELSRAVFGTLEDPGIAAQLRSLKRWMAAGGTVGLALQLIQTFQLQDPIKHTIAALIGAHY